MNKYQRKNKPFRSDFMTRTKLAQEFSSATENKPPSAVKVNKNVGRPMVNRCCLVRPKQKDFGQITKLCTAETVIVPQCDRYTNVLIDRCDFEPVDRKITTVFREGKDVLSGDEHRVENGSQYNYSSSLPGRKFVETDDATQWQNVDNIHDVDRYVQATMHKGIDFLITAAIDIHGSRDQQLNILPRDGVSDNTRLFIITDSRPPIEDRSKPISVHISEVPKVKIILEKFSKLKQDNVELRRLDEKVVCVEYDVYDYSSIDAMDAPIQTMRVFFSLKPNYEDVDRESVPLKKLPANIKRKFDILNEDLKHLTIKEIEIIDDSIETNKQYLDDLRRILKREQFVTANKGKSSINLRALYEIARRENKMLYSNFTHGDIFSKSELENLKKLIIQRCNSSVHGISRRRIKNGHEYKLGAGILSGSIMSELLR